MSNTEEWVLPENIQSEIEKQAENADVPAPNGCSGDERVPCEALYGPHAVESKILVSISENINTMAEAIKESEKQKHDERAKCVKLFSRLLIFLTCSVVALIFVDTFTDFTVRLEFLASVILAILADVFAIVHTLVKYMTNTENYEAYGKLIDSLLKHIDCK